MNRQTVFQKIIQLLAIVTLSLSLVVFCPVNAPAEALPADNPTEEEPADAGLDPAGYETVHNAGDILKVMERHTSMLIEGQIFYQDEVIGTQYRYADADHLCMLSSDGVGYLDTADLSVMAGDTFPGKYCTYIADTEETYRKWFERDYEDFSAGSPEDERLDTTERKDGLFVVCTELKSAEEARDRIEDLAESYGGYPYQEGMNLRHRYVYDPEASDLLSEEVWIAEADGTEHLLTRDSYTYDVSFDYTLEGYPLHDYFHAGGNTRTVFVTYGPGTESETTRTCTIPTDTGFIIYKGDQAVEVFYTDPACTQPFTGSDGTADLHLYVK